MDPLWIDFLNSDWHDPLGHAPRRDRLQEPAWLGEFLAKWKLPGLGPCEPEDARALGALRGELHGLVTRMVAGQRLRPADLEGLNRRLAALPVTARLQVEGDSVQVRLEPAPASGGVDAAVLAIVESFSTFLAGGDPARLRICQNADCQWVFYDATRSRTRRWCADSCGNLIKVRKFRRLKSGRSASSGGQAATRTPPARRPKRR